MDDREPNPFNTLTPATPECRSWWYWWPAEWSTESPDANRCLIPLAVWQRLTIPEGQKVEIARTPYYRTPGEAKQALQQAQAQEG